MSNFPSELKYTKEHEWVKIEGNFAIVGITDYAQEQLGDVVMVELPEEGREVSKDDTFGVVESVKSVSDVFSPLSGKVAEVNEPLANSPNMVNEDCYGEGWLVKLELTNPEEVASLMSARDYQEYLKE